MIPFPLHVKKIVLCRKVSNFCMNFWGVKLTTQPHPVPGVRMCGAVPPLPTRLHGTTFYEVTDVLSWRGI
jgi:hypothetical protein